MIQQPPNQELAARDCGQDIKQWWKNVPFINRQLLLVCGALLIIDTLMGNLALALFINFPVYTLTKYQVWRLITTIFVHTNIIDFIISFLMMYQLGVQIEKTIGSVHFLLELLGKNLLIQTMFSIIIFLLSFLNSGFAKFHSSGLFPTFIMLQTLQCLAYPEQQIRFFCFPVMVKGKYYFWLVFAFFCLLNGTILWDLLCAILLAQIEVQYFNNDLFKFSAATITRIENSCLFNRFLSHPNFIHKSNSSQSYQVTNQLNIQDYSEHLEGQQGFQGVGIQIGQNAPNPQQSASNQYVINPSLNQQKQASEEAVKLARQAALLREQQIEKQKQEETTDGASQQPNTGLAYPEEQTRVPSDPQQQGKPKDKGYTSLNEENSQTLI